ncbi:hypothetical protein FC754_10705 [Clostridium botulinum]|nr:hypothetical protein [Clostridium botulinum]
MKKIKRFSLMLLAVITVVFVNPIKANAEWEQNNTGWWYTEGNSWSTGWRLINGNWYYFYSDGYMAHDTTIDGYYLNSSGAWTNSTLTVDQAKQIALNKVKEVRYPNSNTNVIVIPYFDIYEEVIEGRSGYIITIGEDNTEHTVPTARVFVDKHTGEVFDAFNIIFGIGDSKLKELE